MGFAWELANVRDFGMPEVWDCPSPAPSPRHRKPRRPLRGATGHFRDAALAARAASRRARLILTARPVLADHRRAF
jgi:hypothetical protein